MALGSPWRRPAAASAASTSFRMSRTCLRRPPLGFDPKLPLIATQTARWLVANTCSQTRHVGLTRIVMLCTLSTRKMQQSEETHQPAHQTAQAEGSRAAGARSGFEAVVRFVVQRTCVECSVRAWKLTHTRASKPRRACPHACSHARGGAVAVVAAAAAAAAAGGTIVVG